MTYSALASAFAGALLLASLLDPGTVRADGGADAAPDDALNEIVVVANRAPEPLTKVGNSVTVIDELTIRDSQAVAVSDLLATAPGLTVSRGGGPGQPTSVFIRGAESDQTAVVIDGVLFNDPSSPGGGFDFSNLLTGDIARIEILRGAGSTLYGSQAIGGVIDVTTAEPTSAFGGSFSTEKGTFDTGYTTARFGGKDEGLLWEIAGNYLKTRGISALDETLGGFEPDGTRNGSASARVRYDFTPDVALDVRGYYTNSRTEFDGYDTPTGAFNFDGEWGTAIESIGYAGLTVHSPGGALLQRFALQYTDTDRRDYDPNITQPSSETFYGVGRNERVEYQGTWHFAPTWQAVFGLQHERSSIDTDTPAYDVTPMPVDDAVTINSEYLQLQDELLPGFTLTGGVRHDKHDIFGSHTTGQAAAAWTPDAGVTVLRASFGQGFKAPSLYQLYSPYGNLALQPELGSSWDAGIERRFWDRRLLLGATYFSRTSRDLIEFFECPLNAPNPLCAIAGGYYANLARAAAHGVEFESSLAPAPAWTLAGHYTYTATADRSQGSATYGNELPLRPARTADASVTYDWPFKLRAALAVRAAGRTYADSANSIVLHGYAVIDIRTAYTLSEHWELYARLENAADQHYETAYQYAQPTRGVYAGFRAAF